MKRLFLMLCAMIVSVPAFCENEFYAMIDAKVYNEFINRRMPTQFVVGVSEEYPGSACVIFRDTLNNAFFIIDEPRRNRIISIIDKYIEWNKKASAEGITLEKEIDTMNFNLSGFSLMNETYATYSSNITFSFSSVDKKTHQFVLEFDQLHSRDNEYLTYQPQKTILDYSSAIKFRDAMKTESLKNALAAIKKKNGIADKFQ